MFDFIGTRELPDGDAGTWATLDTMRQSVQDALADPYVRAWAHEIVRDAGGLADREGRAVLLRRWLAERVRFVDDPVGVEWVAPPAALLRDIEKRHWTLGDCDDVATLGAALAGAMGQPARFVVIGFEPGGPMKHVFSEVWTGRRWLDLDTTRRAQDIMTVNRAPRRWTVPAT